MNACTPAVTTNSGPATIPALSNSRVDLGAVTARAVVVGAVVVGAVVVGAVVVGAVVVGAVGAVVAGAVMARLGPSGVVFMDGALPVGGMDTVWTASIGRTGSRHAPDHFLARQIKEKSC